MATTHARRKALAAAAERRREARAGRTEGEAQGTRMPRSGSASNLDERVIGEAEARRRVAVHENTRGVSRSPNRASGTSSPDSPSVSRRFALQQAAAKELKRQQEREQSADLVRTSPSSNNSSRQSSPTKSPGKSVSSQRAIEMLQEKDEREKEQRLRSWRNANVAKKLELSMAETNSPAPSPTKRPAAMYHTSDSESDVEQSPQLTAQAKRHQAELTRTRAEANEAIRASDLTPAQLNAQEQNILKSASESSARGTPTARFIARGGNARDDARASDMLDSQKRRHDKELERARVEAAEAARAAAHRRPHGRADAAGTRASASSGVRPAAR